MEFSYSIPLLAKEGELTGGKREQCDELEVERPIGNPLPLIVEFAVAVELTYFL